jgi:carboxylesterase type B
MRQLYMNLNLGCRALAFGTASIAEYDGASLASNQSIVVVSFNYRTNVFGFPQSPDLPLTGNNLGFLDQGRSIFESCAVLSLT